MQFTIHDSTLGLVLVAERAAGLCAVLLGDDAAALREDLQRRFPGETPVPGDDAAEARARAVITTLETPAGAALSPALALEPDGSPFQRAVWQALREIPSGTTASYAEVAARIGRPGSARAVAQACAANPIAVLVPCHRVVRADGALAGYRWGVERKRALLRREKVALGQ
jgi:O-6-methylguanine DNA methyltransferase